MEFSVHTTLENKDYQLIPLQENDFESLYEVASDPRVWEQHPDRERYKRDVFQEFFRLAIENKATFKIVEKVTGRILGSTRFYDFDETNKSIFIGYTFYGIKSWGTGINPQIKKIMLDYIFQFVDVVYFHVGKENYRSQKALAKIAATKMKEDEKVHYFVFQIKKENYFDK